MGGGDNPSLTLSGGNPIKFYVRIKGENKMLRKCLTIFLVAALTASLSICASAANNQVAVSIPSFSVSLTS